MAPAEGQVANDFADRYGAARAFTREGHQIFDNTAAGRTIARGPYGAPEKLPDSDVAKQFFKSRGRAEDWDNFSNATGQNPAALAALRDYAAFDLRRTALRDDGSLNVIKYGNWMRDHAEQLSRSPDLMRSFETMRQAQATLDVAGQRREAITDQFRRAMGESASTLMNSRYWLPGDRGADGVRAFMAETGGAPEARQTLADHAAASLRGYAAPDGKLDLGRYNTWMKRYARALGEVPDVAAKFGTAARAQADVETSVAVKADAIRRYEKSAAAHFLNNDDPVTAAGKALTSGDPLQNMRELSQLTQRDPAAQNGLRRATLEWLMRRAAPQGIAGKEAGQTGADWLKNQTLRNTVDKYGPALREVFTPEQMRVIDRVAESLKVSDRSISGSKPPIGPGTARDIAALGRYGTDRSGTLLGAVLAGGSRVGAVLAGHAIAGPAGGVAGYAVREGVAAGRASMASARQEQVKQLLIGGLLDPVQGRMLLAKATPQNMDTLAARMSKRLAQATLAYETRTGTVH